MISSSQNIEKHFQDLKNDLFKTRKELGEKIDENIERTKELEKEFKKEVGSLKDLVRQLLSDKYAEILPKLAEEAGKAQ